MNNSVAARWYQMGVVLGVPPSDLEIIRESPEYHGAGEREAGMLKAWLERGMLPRTWQVQHIYSMYLYCFVHVPVYTCIYMYMYMCLSYM